MNDDLVQRLRSNRPIPTLPHEAADRIEEMDRHLTMSGKVNKALSERIEVLEAENKWLREGVKRVENNNRELRGSKERVYAATDLRQPTQSDAVQAEIEALRHDLERQMTIANEQVNEVERLREALAHIAFSGADGPYGEFGEALNEHQMRRVAKAALQEQSK